MLNTDRQTMKSRQVKVCRSTKARIQEKPYWKGAEAFYSKDHLAAASKAFDKKSSKNSIDRNVTEDH